MMGRQRKKIPHEKTLDFLHCGSPDKTSLRDVYRARPDQVDCHQFFFFLQVSTSSGDLNKPMTERRNNVIFWWLSGGIDDKA